MKKTNLEFVQDASCGSPACAAYPSYKPSATMSHLELVSFRVVDNGWYWMVMVNDGQ